MALRRARPTSWATTAAASTLRIPGTTRHASTTATTTSHLRSQFLGYFASHDHVVLPSGSVVPGGEDRSLLFTNSGMAPLKNNFVSQNANTPARACSAQRCIRAGGKHNDLDNVGFTPRHHTMFEMLGNFSFGDYFKEEAIAHAWHFVNTELQLPSESLRITHLHGDDEARDLWKKIAGGKLADSQIIGLGKSDNFWTMGDGKGVPCGPSSEIFVDLGAESGLSEDDRWLEIWNLVFMQNLQDGSGGVTDLSAKCVDTGMGLERLASVMQGVYSNYDNDSLRFLIQHADELVRKSVSSNDKATGSGLSTMMSSSMELGPVNLIGTRYREPSEYECALRVIADHMRASAFIISDGVMPSNVGRGYVLRRILRRAMGYAYQLGVRGPLLSDLIPAMLESLSAEAVVGQGEWQSNQHPHAHLVEQAKTIQVVVRGEEEIFSRTVSNGMSRLQSQLADQSGGGVLAPEFAFMMYDTFGFPLDLTALLARSHGIAVDVDAAQSLLRCAQQANQPKAEGSDCVLGSASASSSSSSSLLHPSSQVLWDTQTSFVGYNQLSVTGCAVTEAGGFTLSDNGSVVRGWCVLDQSPFYAESGGQVGDRGCVYVRRSNAADSDISVKIDVVDTTCVKRADNCNVGVLHVEIPVERLRLLADAQDAVSYVEEVMLSGHVGRVDSSNGSISDDEAVGDCCWSVECAEVDVAWRHASGVHHTSTHLLHAALRQVLGEAVVQAGSLVSPDRLRFDFAFPRALSADQIAQVEKIVNAAALQNLTVDTTEMSIADAKQLGATMLFGERYGDVVRVVRVASSSSSASSSNDNQRAENNNNNSTTPIAAVSMELCGGTHVSSTQAAYPFVITSDSSVAAGTRRIEALAGARAVNWLTTHRNTVATLAQTFKCSQEEVMDKVHQTRSELKSTRKELATAREKVVESMCADHTDPVLKLSAGDGALDFPVWIYRLPESMSELVSELVVGDGSEKEEAEAAGGANKKKKKKKGKGKDDPCAKLMLQHGRRLVEENPHVCHVLVLGDRIACAVAPSAPSSSSASSSLSSLGGAGPVEGNDICTGLFAGQANIAACGGAGKLLGRVLKGLGGKGGGGPDFAAGSLPQQDFCIDTLGAAFTEAVETPNGTATSNKSSSS